MNKTDTTLVVIAGPTAVGKTKVAVQLAEHWQTEIISTDSRQFYRELNKGTAKPDDSQLSQVQHHFIGQLSIQDYYNVSRFENEALAVLQHLFTTHEKAILTGGSGLYIDAICNGIDDFPDPPDQVRRHLRKILDEAGKSGLQELLSQVDPQYFQVVDKENPARLLRALEVCLTTGRKFSEMRLNNRKARDFGIVKIVLNLPRQELFNRIEARVDEMIESGLEEEVRSLLPFRNLNALNTLGYREMLDYIDGKISFLQAVEKIKTNTRRYAKRQLTWFRKDQEYVWFEPGQVAEIIRFIEYSIDMRT